MSDKEKLLKAFMQEHFPYSEFKKVGLFPKEIKGNYQAQAERVCMFFGYKTVYEFGAKEIRCHISYAQNERPLFVDENGRLKIEPFITVIPNIYK